MSSGYSIKYVVVKHCMIKDIIYESSYTEKQRNYTNVTFVDSVNDVSYDRMINETSYMITRIVSEL